MQHNFTEDDKAKVIDFLNMVGNHAELKMNTQEIIKYFGLLSFMQKTLLPKIDANIFEIKKVVEAPKEEPKKKEPKAKKAE